MPLGPASALVATSILSVEAEEGGRVGTPSWSATNSSVLVGFVRSVPRLSLEGEGAASPSRSCRRRSPSLKSVSGGGAAGAAMLASALLIVGGRRRDPGTGWDAGGQGSRFGLEKDGAARKPSPIGRSELSRLALFMIRGPGTVYLRLLK